VGIALRTHNGKAFEAIPPHWAAFGQARLAARPSHRRSDDVWAVCTNFESVAIDHNGRCTLVIGNAVPGQWADRPPEVQTPASLRAVFPMEKRSFDLVEAEWQAIWQSSRPPAGRQQ